MLQEIPLLFSLNSRLEYTGFNQPYKDWVTEHFRVSIKQGDPWPGFKTEAEKSVKKVQSRFRDLLSAKTIDQEHIDFLNVYDGKLACRSLMKSSDGADGITVLSYEHTQEDQARYTASDLLNLELVAKNVQNSVVITDATRKVEYVNPAFEKLTGYTFKETIGKTLSFLQGEATSKEALKKLRRALVDHVEFSTELLNYHKSGESYWVEVYITPIFDDQGKLTKYIGLQNDITKRKKREEEIRRNEAEYYSIINSLHEGVVVQDAGDKVFLANDSAARILGLTRDQLLGKDSYDPRWKALDMEGQPLDPNRHPSVVTLRTGKPVTNFLMNIHVGNEDRRVISINSEPVKDAEGQVTAVVATFLDVTEQMETQQELKDSEERYKLLVENATVGIILHMDGKIKIRNTYAARLLAEHPKGALINSSFMDTIHPDFKKITENRYARLKANQTSKLEALEQKMITLHGEVIDVLQSGIAINYDGKPAFLTVFSDISRIKESENIVRENQERISNLANSVPGAMLQYKINPDGSDELPYISDQVVDLWEESKDAALADVNVLWNAIHPKDIRGMRASIQRSLQNLSFWDHTYRIKTKSGKIKWLNGRGVPKRLEDGSVLWDTLIFDITEQKNVENQLLEANRQLALAVDTAKLGIWIYNISEDQLQWNDTLHEMYDISKEEFTQNIYAWREKLHEEDAQYALEEFDKIEHGDTVHDVRFRIRPALHKVRHIQASGAPLKEEDGRILKLIGINQDVTDFVEKEKILQEALDVKNTLLKELHHRVKNNLNLISNLLYFKSKATENQGLLDYIKDTRSRINTIAKTHDQLLEMEEFDRLNVKIYLEDLVLSIIGTYTTEGSNYHTTLEIEPIKLSVDKILIIGLLANEIILNIIKHAYDPGVGGPIYVSLQRQEESVRLTVSDQGVGMKTAHEGDNESTGLELIQMLTTQLKGKSKLESENGVMYMIEFDIG